MEILRGRRTPTLGLALLGITTVPTPASAGTWEAHTIADEFLGAWGVHAADIDGDGDEDVLGSARDADLVAWWENVAGDGSAWLERTVDSLDGAVSPRAADVDGDGDFDVLSGSVFADSLSWWENTQGNGSVWAERTIGTGTPAAVAIDAADVDGDGDLDVVTASAFQDEIDWWENLAGDGSQWLERGISADADSANSVHAADLDGDGDLDILAAASNADAILWWENLTGDGLSWLEHVVDGAFLGAVAVYSEDVDGDGDLDVLGGARVDDQIAWWENLAGDGTSWAKHIVGGNFDAAEAVYAADVDSDGDIDVLGAAYQDGAVTLWENANQLGTAWTEQPVSGFFEHADSVFAADVDGDGDLDVLAAAEQFTNEVVWWENDLTSPGVRGSVRGFAPQSAVCRNLTTGQQVIVLLAGATSWNCENAGLVVNPGDLVATGAAGPSE